MNYKKRIGAKQATLLLSCHLFHELPQEKQKLLVEWLEYKKDIKKGYKSPRSIKILINKFSAHDAKELKKVIENSIQNGWAGLFFPNKTHHDRNTKNPGPQIAASKTAAEQTLYDRSQRNSFFNL